MLIYFFGRVCKDAKGQAGCKGKGCACPHRARPRQGWAGLGLREGPGFSRRALHPSARWGRGGVRGAPGRGLRLRCAPAGEGGCLGEGPGRQQGGDLGRGRGCGRAPSPPRLPRAMTVGRGAGRRDGRRGPPGASRHWCGNPSPSRSPALSPPPALRGKPLHPNGEQLRAGGQGARCEAGEPGFEPRWRGERDSAQAGGLEPSPRLRRLPAGAQELS